MTQSAPMNGGDGEYSYAKNSSFQRESMIGTMKGMEKIFKDNLDIKSILSGSTQVRIADLGCSVGPNTFFAMQTIVELVEDGYYSHESLGNKNLEFQIFFNDQTTNDFNTLFNSLPPERKYFAAGVPGSFYNRLFPLSFIHIAFSSLSLHWLSKVPNKLQIKGSPAWNKGRIHYTGASDAVVQAYADQFAEDMEIFLSARAHEIIKGGLIIILMPGVHDGSPTHLLGLALTFVESILMDMVNEGILNEDQVDSFNFPNMYPSVKEMTRIVEKNGCFSIVKMELRNDKNSLDIEGVIMHLRAAIEGTIASHFGSHLVDEIFQRVMLRRADFSHTLYSSGIEFPVQLFAVLKRN